MDQRVIEEKLKSLRRCIQRVKKKRPPDVDELETNFDLQDIISVNLERAVQLCVDIGAHIIASTEEEVPNSMGEIFALLLELEVITKQTAEVMKKAVGFRNITVHNYQQIDWNIVYNISTRQIDDFRKFAKEVSNYALDT